MFIQFASPVKSIITKKIYYLKSLPCVNCRFITGSMSKKKDFSCTTVENKGLNFSYSTSNHLDVPNFHGHLLTFSSAKPAPEDEKLIYPAATRNKEPILQVLKRFLSSDSDNNELENPLFLEIASGSGQHMAHFAPHFPNIRFQPTEIDESLFGSITYYAKNCPTGNIMLPMTFDVRNKLSFYGFSEDSIDYLYNANMIHISPYECTIGLFENAGNYLKSDALMITYGPYSKDGIITPESNIEFDASLRAQNPSWGLRDINLLVKLGDENNLSLIDTIEMPANNKILIWKKN